MIYNAATQGIGVVGWGTLYLKHAIETAYGKIGRALKLKVPASRTTEAAKGLNRTSALATIHGVSMRIGSLIALWHLVTAMLP
jgi:hypothetical protein